jgi:hypothetical protein
MSGQYEDILKRQYGNIQKTKCLPTGSWELTCRNASFSAPAEGSGKNPSFLFAYAPQSAKDDVDEEALGSLGANYDVAENRVFYRIWYETGRDMEAFFAHVEKHGVDVTPDMTVEDAMKAVKGKKIVSYLGKRTYKNKAGDMVTDNDPESFTPVA